MPSRYLRIDFSSHLDFDTIEILFCRQRLIHLVVMIITDGERRERLKHTSLNETLQKHLSYFGRTVWTRIHVVCRRSIRCLCSPRFTPYDEYIYAPASLINERKQ